MRRLVLAIGAVALTLLLIYAASGLGGGGPAETRSKPAARDDGVRPGRAAMAATVAASASDPVPAGWIGVNLEPVPVDKVGDLDTEFAMMRRARVSSARVAVYWGQMQPAASAAVAGGSAAAGEPRIRFARLDRLVANAAEHGVSILPVVLEAPRWASEDPFRVISPPRDPAAYARFVTALVQRYGPDGSFWTGREGSAALPIRRWQIWNEVSNPFYWGPSWPSAYPPLLRAAYDAIKAADPQAQVLMSGINTGGAGGAEPFPSWTALGQIYQQLDEQGLGRPFDAIAVHVYTRRVGDALRVVRKMRQVMARYGDADRELRVTELAWPAARGRLRDSRGRRYEFFAATDRRGMARRLVAGLRLLARHRREMRIGGVDWFQWSSRYRGVGDPFQYSGLRRVGRAGIEGTSALRAFRRVVRELERG